MAGNSALRNRFCLVSWNFNCKKTHILRLSFVLFCCTTRLIGALVNAGGVADEKAEHVLNAALEVSRNSIRSVMQEGTREKAASMRAEVETGSGRVAVLLRQVRMVSILNVVASCITLVAVAIAVWAVMH